jgi:hypothetical protein
MEVSPTGPGPGSGAATGLGDPANVLQFLVTVQHQQLELTRQIHEMHRQMLEIQRQQLDLLRENPQLIRDPRARQVAELERWQQSHEQVVESCRHALGRLEPVHATLMRELTEYVDENHENLLDGDFTLSDFVDRFGPRLAHLNTILAVLRPLAAGAKKPDQPGEPTG